MSVTIAMIKERLLQIKAERKEATKDKEAAAALKAEEKRLHRMLLDQLSSFNITLISDTMGLHHNLRLKPGFILVHAGNITLNGKREEYNDFIQWFGRQPFDHKIFIGGNHDLCLQQIGATNISSSLPRGIHYLENSAIELIGIKIYGTPVTPYLMGSAFIEHAEATLGQTYNKIPEDTDLLITHAPPAGILDGGYGSMQLLKKVKKVRPSIHAFGNVPGQEQVCYELGTCYINACLSNRPMFTHEEDFALVKEAVVIGE